ncbi:MAG: hypothetical protein M3M87_03645, partial [Thermoproteota archaeon]|nr:hypothetical protein [Thermoproteota archaeon]
MGYANTFQYNETLITVYYLDVRLGLINRDCLINIRVEINTAIEKKAEKAVITQIELPSVATRYLDLIDYIN